MYLVRQRDYRRVRPRETYLTFPRVSVWSVRVCARSCRDCACVRVPVISLSPGCHRLSTCRHAAIRGGLLLYLFTSPSPSLLWFLPGRAYVSACTCVWYCITRAKIDRLLSSTGGWEWGGGRRGNVWAVGFSHPGALRGNFSLTHRHTDRQSRHWHMLQPVSAGIDERCHSVVVFVKRYLVKPVHLKKERAGSYEVC